MTLSKGEEFEDELKKSETEGSNEKLETLRQDETVSNIKEWLLQEKLLLQELKRFKPVRQPNNPNPPWEFYLLRQRQLVLQLKVLRRRIEMLGKEDEYFIELRNLSPAANRLLELLNRGVDTDYNAAAAGAKDLMLEIESVSASLEDNKKKDTLLYQTRHEEGVPETYQDAISRYFRKLSEE